MTPIGDREGDDRRSEARALLEAAAGRAAPLAFWWRDDDAETISPQLERLLRLARRHAVPLALAVVPFGATSELAQRLADAPEVAVLQHGWRHRAHNPPGERKVELGRHRPLEVVIAELDAGRRRLVELMPDRFRPILVPPWNRIAPEVAAARRQAGLVGLSSFGSRTCDDPHVVNVHLDIRVWRPERRAATRAEVYGRLALEISRRLAGDPEPIGIMSHHLVHDEETWALLDELLADLASHPGAAWPSIDALFGLAPVKVK